MCWNQNKSLLGVLFVLSLTSFVTACVKNASKNENPTEVAFKELQSQELTEAQMEGSQAIEIRDSSERPAIDLTQLIKFKVSDVRDFSVQQGLIHNKDCRGEGPFNYHLTLISPDGVEKPIHARRNKELLVPGHYVLQVKVENHALCENVALDLRVTSRVREDLVMTEHDNRGYICYEVEENGAIQSTTRIRVNTNPLQVVKYKNLNGGGTRTTVIESNNSHCAGDLNPRTECSEGLLPAEIDAHPVVSVQRNCRNPNGRDRGFAQMLVSRSGFLKGDIDFTCRHKRNNLRLEMKNCDQIFNLGEAMPIRPGQTDITLRPRQMRIGFEPIYGEIDDRHIPDNLWVGLVKVSKEEGSNDYYEPVFPSFYSIDKDDLLNGQITIREAPGTNLKMMATANDVNDLVLVFSRTPNMRQGLYHIKFSQLCADSANNLVIGNNHSGDNALCE